MLVSNTSTLVLLAKIDCLEKFVELSLTIEIPIQVKTEALFYEESYYARLIKKLIQDKKLIVREVDSKGLDNVMKEFRLDIGEAATYVLYDNKKHKAILTDDGELIKLCKLENIPFICSMAIVIRMKEKEIMSKEDAKAMLNKLNKIGRYSNEIYEYFINQI